MQKTTEFTHKIDPEKISRRISLRLLMRYEWRQMSRDKTLWAGCLILAVLMLYAALNGAAWIDFQRQTIEKALAEEATRLDSMRDELRAGEAKPKLFRDPGRPGWVGEFLGTRYATLPPAPLAALSVGQRDLYPYYFRVSTLSADSFINEDEIENPFNLLTGRFDSAFVLVYLFPLVILALSYNLLSGEKESGTLQLALSQPLGAARLLTGKMLARALPVIALAVLLSVVAVFWGGTGTDCETLIRLSLWSLATASYALFWFAVAAWVNAFGKSSATNAIVLSAVWLALSVLVPVFVSLLAGAVHPVESRLLLITELREAQRESVGRANEILEEFYRSNPALRPAEPDKNDYMPGFYAAQEWRDKKNAPLIERHDEHLARQNRLAESLRVLSPVMSLQSAFNDLSATTFDRYREFLRQTRRFHVEWKDFFLPKMFKRERLTAEDYARFPKFSFAEEPFGQVLGRICAGFAAVLSPAFALAFYAFRRLKAFPVSG